MEPSSFVTVLVVGAVAGWIASYLVRGRGFGILGNMLLGIVGSFIGSFAAGLVGFQPAGLVGSVIVAVVGAAALIGVIAFIRSR